MAAKPRNRVKPMILRLCLAVCLMLPQTALAMRDPAQLCEAAAVAAGRQVGVPAAVMRALTLTETGRNRDGALRPWPWAINHGGEGAWFPTEAEALAFARTTLAGGARNFDVGCFQLNHRWHGDAFPDLETMFDPMSNAVYAARFLRTQYDAHGTWTAAAGAYHSNTPEYAERYRTRFAQLYAGLDEAPDPAAPDMAAPRVNRFPLLNGGAGAGGSLVPQLAAANRLIGN